MRKAVYWLWMGMLLCLLYGTAFGEQPLQVRIQTEAMQMAASDISGKAWETAVAGMRTEGLSNRLDMDTIRQNDSSAVFDIQNGNICSIQGTQLAGPVTDPLDAYRTAYQLVTLLGGTDETRLDLWSVLSMGNKTIYVFQEVHAGLTVIASTMRIVTEEDGMVSAVFSSIADSEKENDNGTEMLAEEAEAVVSAYLSSQKMDTPILSEYTNKVIIPIDSDIDDNNIYPDQVFWTVYTQNPESGSRKTADLPYLAHYVQMDGTYLYSIPVSEPRDMASLSGFGSVYTFEYMEADEWTGTVTWSDGKTQELTVPVMRDPRTNAYYLGDIERRIAVADFASMAYGNRIVRFMVKSQNEWDDNDLIVYANYIKTWDFYAQMGWNGPDGFGTPSLLLRDLCEKDGTPMENACYIGKSQGWQCFGYSEKGHLGECLDVIVHEFTHCITHTLMNTNLYKDDMGAINEAFSDILGNIGEMMMEGTTDKTWLIGENSGSGVRSMSDPHRHDQPEYVWDLFYTPHTDTPNEVNDRGGVHYNSSLLNYIAAHLCLDGGMPLEAARDFWMTAACGLTPKADYSRMPALLHWALAVSGNDQYKDTLTALLDYCKLDRTEYPETYPDGQHLAILELPDTPVMQDPHWVLLAIQVDTAEIRSRSSAIVGLLNRLMNDNKTEEELDDLLSRLHLDGMSFRLDEKDEKDDSLIKAFSEVFTGIISQHFSWRQSKTSHMPMVLSDQMTFYMLLNVDEDALDLHGFAILLGDRWFDFGTIITETEDAPDGETAETGMSDEMMLQTFNMVRRFLFGLKTPDDVLPVRMIPNTGLEQVKLFDSIVEKPDEDNEKPQDEAA
ncbi:MAG: M4 family metallopeptidase [Clostridia bacterium]|nr:M4 family metallopeptidase [Clostridia bacterium]